jgi:dihydrofolate reductase
MIMMIMILTYLNHQSYLRSLSKICNHQSKIAHQFEINYYQPAWMRRLIVSLNVSLDGFISGPDGELDWHINCWSGEMGEALCARLAKADTLLLGRVTYEAMARYWPAQLNSSSCREADYAFAEMMCRYEKIVFTNTLSSPTWSHTTFVDGDVKQTIDALKRQPGRDIMVYGSGQLVQSLMQTNSVDEYQLWLHPVLLGAGKRLFQSTQSSEPLNLICSETFPSGVMMVRYETRRP